MGTDDDELELDWGGREVRDTANAPPASTGREPGAPSALARPNPLPAEEVTAAR